ncbi:MAG: hypothetical protein ACRDI0_07820 [Actinomycetota bacterium]
MEAASLEEYRDAFARIEREVDAGNTDLAGLGFWRLVTKVKLDPLLSERWADVVGRIDRAAFQRRVRPRFPVWLGNAVLLAGTAVLVAVVPVAVAVARRSASPDPAVAGLLALVAAGGLSVTTHDLAHWAAGRMAGIRFVGYFLDGPFRIQPGLKTDYATYLRAPPRSRAGMHAAGAVASKVAPFAVFGAVYLPHRAAGFALFPSWALWAILGVGVVEILTDVVWSTKRSDWRKVRRERAVARAVEHPPPPTG